MEAGANTFEKCWCKGAYSLVSERFKFSCIRKLLAELVLGTQLLPPPLLFTGLQYHNLTSTTSAGMGNHKEPWCAQVLFFVSGTNKSQSCLERLGQGPTLLVLSHQLEAP